MKTKEINKQEKKKVTFQEIGNSSVECANMMMVFSQSPKAVIKEIGNSSVECANMMMVFGK